MENQTPISKPETAAPTEDVVGVDVPPLVLPLPGFTPGPWKHMIHEVHGEQRHVVETGPPAWVPLYPDGMTDEEIAANCDLISAAPELLEVTVKMLRAFEYLAGEYEAAKDPVIVAARAAVAKASGQNSELSQPKPE